MTKFWNPALISEENLKQYSGRDLQTVATCYWTSINCWALLLFWVANKASRDLALSRMNSASFQRFCSISFSDQKDSTLVLREWTVLLSWATVSVWRMILPFSFWSSCCSFAHSDSALKIHSVNSARRPAFMLCKAAICSSRLFDLESAQACNPSALSLIFCNRLRKARIMQEILPTTQVSL